MTKTKITICGSIEAEASKGFCNAWHCAVRGEIFSERRHTLESRKPFFVYFYKELTFLALAIALLASPSHPQTNLPSAEDKPTPGIYIPPNEQHPAIALPILLKSNHGVYISVGSERSFIGAALTRAVALYVIDYDADTIRFANINRALLAASTSREDYLYLRLTAPADTWLKRSRQLTGDDKAILANPASWSFWLQTIRKNLSAWDDAFLHFHTQPTKPGDPFFAANYLFDDALYSHLSHLAKTSRIWARVLDLRNENEVRALCLDLKSKALKFGVIDTSDMPNSPSGGRSVVADYVKLFSEYAQPETLFLNTAPVGGGHGVKWSYYAFSNKNIRAHDPHVIEHWYEIEMKKINATDQPHAFLDDPDAINH